MNDEQLLRDALHDDAVEAPTPAAWRDVRARGLRIRARRVRTRLASGGAAALALGAVVTFAVVGGDAQEHRIVAAPDTEPQIVAAVDDRIVVMSPIDGSIVRTLLEGPDASDVTGVSATPDGRTVYFTRGGSDVLTCEPSSASAIYAVPASGGTVERVASGSSPSVSPDGRYLAYVSAAVDAASPCEPHDSLVVRDLVTGAELRHQEPARVDALGTAGWASNRRLLASVDPLGASLRSYLMVTVTDDALAAEKTEVPYFSNGAAPVPGGVGIATPISGGTRIEVVDPRTGDQVRVLFEGPGQLFGPHPDSTGTRLLLTSFSDHDVPQQARGLKLYRLGPDDQEPVEVADPVRAAAWLPVPPSVPTGREVVAVVGHDAGGDDLVVMSADDGHVIRTLADGVGVTLGGIAVTPDGSTVYFTRARHGLPCGTTEIARVPVAGGAIETVASPGASPVIGPDGTELVWARPMAADPCGAMTYLSRAPVTEAGDIVPAINVGFGESPTSSVRPWAWSPDGTRIVVGGRDGEERWPSVATLGLPWLEDRVDLQLPSEADDATYLPDGRLVVAFIDEATGGHRLVTYDARSGAPVETIFETSTSGIWNIEADASGEVLIHAGGDLLQRWTPGEGAAATVATGVRDAAWVPAPRPTEAVDPTPVSRAAEVVAVGGGQAVVLDDQGAVDRVLADGVVADDGVVSATPDGRSVYLARRAASGGCPGPDIVRIATAGGEPEIVVRAAVRPLVSPDGRWLAFAGYSGCDDARATLGLVDLATGAEVRPLEALGEPASFTRPLAWAPDGALLYQANHVGVLSGSNPAPSLLGLVDGVWTPTGPTALPAPSDDLLINAASYLPDGNVVVAASPGVSGPGMRIVVLDPRTGATVAELTDIPERIVDDVAVDPTGTKVLVHRFDDSRLLVVDIASGLAEPRTLARGVRAAGWLPSG